MPWDPAKPGDSDLVFGANQSAKNIRDNFDAIDTAWDINHVGIDDTNGGKHTKVHIREGSQPSTTTNEIVLWCQNPALTGQGAELYIRRESNGDNIPATASSQDAGSDSSNGDFGWTFLPSGILLKWGRVNTAGGDQSITFSTGTTLPAFTEVYRAFLQPVDSANGDSDDYVRLKSLTTTTLSYYGSPRTTTGSKAMSFDWLVIGLGV